MNSPVSLLLIIKKMKVFKRLVLSLIILSGSYNIVLAGLDTVAVKNVVKAWNAAHNTQDVDILNELYGSTLLFYTKEYSKENCVNVKLDAFKTYTEFKQVLLTDITIKTYEGGVIKCDFTKEVARKSKKKTTSNIGTYPSYLLIKKIGNQFLIVGESDLITDSKLAYVLKLGKEVNYSDGSTNIVVYIVVCLIIVIIILVIVLLKLKSKNNESKYRNKVELDPIEKEIVTTSVNELNEQNTLTVNNDKANNERAERIKQFNENAEKAKALTKEYLTQGIKNTSTFLTKLFDTVDFIDRKVYGYRMRIFIIGSILVLIVAPVIDFVLQDGEDWVTFFSTFAFLIFVSITVLAYIGSWRDDTGNVTWQRIKFRLETYYQIGKDKLLETKTTALDEALYKLGTRLFFIGIGWKAIQNLSVFIRKPIERFFNFKIEVLRNFEKLTNQWFWLVLLSGIIVLVYLYYKNPKILERIKSELRELFGIKIKSKYSKEIIKIEPKSTFELVLNSKEEEIDSFALSSNSTLLKDFALAIKNWKPHTAQYEYQYQDRLFRHLRKSLPDAVIELEYPIGEKSEGNRGRADIVINDMLLIEMKRDSSAGAIQRAKGQIAQYSEIWKNKGPVVLLLCDYDYEHAKLVYGSTMEDLLKLGRPVLTVVAKPI